MVIGGRRMSKYKVGDKIILTVTNMTEMGGYPRYVLNTNFNLWKQTIDDYAEPLSDYTEPLEAKIRRQAEEITRLLAENERLKPNYENIRAEGQKEAWELARKITCQPINGGFNRSEFEKIFGYGYISDIFEKYKYTEAAEKVAEWEKAKDEIKVGDIVKTKCDTSFEFCVTYIDCNGYLYGLGRYGATYSDKNPEDWENTGRHIDIDSFLKQIGGKE